MKRPGWIVVLWSLLLIAAAVLALRMKPQTSIEGLLDASDPSVAAMSRVLDRFPTAEELLVLVSLPPGENDQGKLLAFAERLGKASAMHADVIAALRYRADASARAFIERFVVPAGLDYLDDAARDQLLARLTPDGIAAQLKRGRDAMSAPGLAAGEVAKQILKDPLWLHEFLQASGSRFDLPWKGDGETFFSRDGRSLLIRIDGTRPPSDLNFCRDITERVTRLTGEVNADNLDVRISGAYAIAAWNASKIRADAIQGTVGSTLGLLLLLVLFLNRPIAHALLMLVPAGVGIVVGFGAYSLFQSELTPLAAVVGGGLGGIGIDYAIQFLSRYLDERKAAASAVAAVSATLRGFFGPLTSAWFTTLIGFATIALSPIRLLRDFSLLGGLTLFGSFVATLTLLPALLVLFDRPQLKPMSRGTRLVRWFALSAARRPRFWVLGTIVLSIAAACIGLSGLRSVAMNSDLTVLHPRPNPPLDAQREISAQMGVAGGSVFIYVQGDTPEQLLERAYAFDRRMNDPAVREAGVVARFGLPSLLPDPRTVARRKAELDPRLPEQVEVNLRAGLAAAGFRAERFESYIEFVKRLVQPHDSPDVQALLRYPEWARIVLSRQALSGEPPTEAISLVFFSQPLDERVFRERAMKAIRTAASGLEGVTLTGLAPITQDVEKVVRRDFLRLFGVAFTLVVIYLVLYLRSLRLAVVALVPTLCSICVLAAFVTVTGQTLNLVNVVMMPLLLGVNIDYGIYAAAAWRSTNSLLALVRKFQTSITAVVLSCLTTVIGFGSLAITSLPAVRMLGWMIIVAIIGCLVGTVLLVWPLLLWRRQRSARLPV
jgi:predicted exporter